MCGDDPDFAKRDLWQHIEDGGQATWTWYVQVMTDEQAATYYVDPFDATKRWNDKDCPPQQLGRIVVNRNPENYHRGQQNIHHSTTTSRVTLEDNFSERRCIESDH